MPRATCQSCLYEFNASAELAGKRIRCPECGAPVSVGSARGNARGNATSRPMPPRVGSPREAPDLTHQTLIKIGVAGGLVVGVGIAVLMFLTGDPVAPLPPPEAALNAPHVPATLPESQVDAPTQPVVATETTDETAVKNEGTPPTPGRRLVGQPVASTVTTDGAIQEASTKSGAPGNMIGTLVRQPDSVSESTTSESATDGANFVAERSEKLELVDLIAIVEPSVVRLNVVTADGFSQGSGFVANGAGTVVTNFHVIEGANEVYAIFSDGREADVAGYRYFDVARDIAILQLDLPDGMIPGIPIASDLPPKGATVYGFGSPQGLDFTTSQGIISAVRSEQTMHEVADEMSSLKGTWLQTTAAISGGSSGGPLIDQAGNVVGINSMTMITGQNLNFAISCVDLREALAKASSNVKPFRADDLRPPAGQGSRELAGDEIDTDRGNKLFADVEEIILLNLAPPEDAEFDTTGRIWATVVAHSEHAVEKMDINLAFGEPAPDAAVMMVVMELTPERNRGVITHTMELSADLICFDPTAPSSRRYARVWHGDAKIGTVSLLALSQGRIPRSMREGLREFFGDFRQAHGAASRAAEKAEMRESGGGDG